MTDIGRAKHKLQFIPPQLRASARVVCDVDVKYFPELIPESNNLTEYNSNNNYYDNSEENGQRLLRNSKRSNQSEHTKSQLQWRGVSRPNPNHAPLHAIRQLATEINDNVPLTDKEFTLFRLAYAECQRHLRGVQVSLLTSSTPIGNVLMMTTQLEAVCSEHDVVLSHYFPKLIEFHNYFLAMHEQHVMGAQGVYFELLMEQLCTLLSRASQFVMSYTSFLEAVQEAERQQQTLFHQYDKEDDVCSFNGGDNNNNNSVNSSYVDQDEMEATSTWESPSAMSHSFSSVATSAYNTSVHWTSQHERHLPSVIDVTALQEKRALARRIREEQKKRAGQHNTHAGTHAFVNTSSTAPTNYNDESDARHTYLQTEKPYSAYTQTPKSYNINSEPEVLEGEYMAVLNSMPFNWACILSRLNAQIALCVSHIDWLVNALTECGLSFNAADYIEDDTLLQLWGTHVGVHKPACTWVEFEPIWLTFPEWCQPAILCILLYGYEKRDDMRRIVVSLYSVNRLLSVLGPLEHLERNLYECAVNNIFSFSLLFDEVQYLFARRSDAKAGDYLVTLTDTPGEVRLIILFETRSAVRVEHSESMNRLNALYLHTLSQQIQRTSLNQTKQIENEHNNNRGSNSYNEADKTCASTNKQSNAHEKMKSKTSFDTSREWNQCFNTSTTKKEEEDAVNDSDNTHRKESEWNNSSNENKDLVFSRPHHQSTTASNNNYYNNNNNSKRSSSADRGNDLFVWFVSSFLQYSVRSSSLANFSNVANIFASCSPSKAEDAKGNGSTNAINTLTSMPASSHEEILSNSWKYNTNRYSLTNEMKKDNHGALLPIISFANLNNNSIKHINSNRHNDGNNDDSCSKDRGMNSQEDQNRTSRAQPLQLLLLQHRQCSEESMDTHYETSQSHSQQQSVESLGYTRKRSYEERVFNSIDDNNSPCTLAPLLTVSHRLLHDSGAWAIHGISREEYESIPQVCKTFEEFMLRACGDDLHVDRLLANNMAVVERLERSLRSRSWYMNEVITGNNNINTSSGRYNNSNKPNSLRAPAKSSSIFSEQHQLQQEQQLGKEAERVRELASSSSLHVACFRNNIRYVRSLLSRGNAALINTPMQDVHIQARVMWTPLLCAINNCTRSDPVEMVCLLLEAGADVLWRDEAHCDALYYAIANGYANTVKVLLEARAANSHNHDNQQKFIQCDDANNNNLNSAENYKDYTNANYNHNSIGNNNYEYECITIHGQWGEDNEGVCTKSRMQIPAVLLALGAHHGLVWDVDIIRFARVMPNASMMAAIAPSINNYNLIMLAIRIMESKMAGVDYTCTLDDKLLLCEESESMKTGNKQIHRQEDTNHVESCTLVQREELRSAEEQQHLNNIIANHTAECVRHIRDMHNAIKPLYNRAYYLS